MPRRAIGFAVALSVAVLGPAAAASASGLVIHPNPVAFGGVAAGSSKVLKVLVTNTDPTTARPQPSISSGTAEFTIQSGTNTCSGRTLSHGARCSLRIVYTPSSKAQDTGTLLVRDKLRPTRHYSAQLTGHRAAPADTTPPNCTMIAKRNQKIIKQVKKGGKKVLKRTRFGVGLTSSEDGLVSARAFGKDSAGQPISLETVDSPATAGNGVALKLRLKKKSENRILADVKKGLEPTMTLVGTCQDKAGNTRQVGAVIHFHDKKPGKPFGFPLIADPRKS